MLMPACHCKAVHRLLNIPQKNNVNGDTFFVFTLVSSNYTMRIQIIVNNQLTDVSENIIRNKLIKHLIK